MEVITRESQLKVLSEYMLDKYPTKCSECGSLDYPFVRIIEQPGLQANDCVLICRECLIKAIGLIGTWTPVGDGFPENGKRVLVKSSSGFVGVSFLDDKMVWRDDSHDEYRVTDVTHWMELPA